MSLRAMRSPWLSSRTCLVLFMVADMFAVGTRGAVMVSANKGWGSRGVDTRGWKDGWKK